MAFTVTATQGGTTANGLALRIIVVTGAAATQNGATANQFVGSSTAFTQSITTTAGSNVYGASSNGQSGATSTGSNATIIDDISDGTNGERYVTWKALNVTAGATVRGYTASIAATGPMAQLEILSAGTLAEDASSPAVASTTTATSVTTASFTPPNGSLLVAMVASDGGAGVTTMALSDTSGLGLTWTEKVKNNQSGGDYAGVWIAPIPAGAAVSGSVQPRATVPVPRRRPSRGVWAGITGQGAARVAAPRQLPATPPRRVPARAYVRFTPVVTVNAVPPPPGVPGTVQPRSTVPVPRRVPGRGQWRGLAVPGISGAAPLQQYRLAPRRAPARAWVQFRPVTTTNAVPPAMPGGTVQPLAARPAPRRILARAYVQFRPVATVNATGIMTPRGQSPFVPDDKSHLKKLFYLLE